MPAPDRADPRGRRPRRVARPAAEPLGTRALLTNVIDLGPPPPRTGDIAETTLEWGDVAFGAPRFAVTAGQPEANVVVRRSPAVGRFSVGIFAGLQPESLAHFLPTYTPVEFAHGESSKTVALPLIPLAPVAGSVEVDLTLVPLDPRPGHVFGPKAVLEVADRVDVTPPRIESARRTPRGVELAFSEPMDEARAGDPANFALFAADPSDPRADWAAYRTPGRRGPAARPIPLRGVSYDPATRTSTLVPARPLPPGGALMVTGRAPVPGGPEALGRPGQPLADRAGNPLFSPIRGDARWTPHGAFAVAVAAR